LIDLFERSVDIDTSVQFTFDPLIFKSFPEKRASVFCVVVSFVALYFVAFVLLCFGLSFFSQKKYKVSRAYLSQSAACPKVRKIHKFRAIVVIGDKITDQNKAVFLHC